MGYKPQVSIITVVYNGEEFLEETILSVINQSYDNVEYIIIDGGSTDGTLDIIKKYEKEINYWVSEKDNGIYDAMNKGIQLFKGDYINFLNAGDNFYSKNILEKIVDEINELDSKPKIIYGGANVYSEDGKFITTLNPLKFNKKNLNRYATRTVCHQSIFIRHDCIKMYSDKYRLKGELNWYYELIKNIEDKYIYKSDIIICDYCLGGTGDKNFKENYFERISVTKQHNSLFAFIILMPFFLIPLVFRLKRVIFGK